MAERTVCDARGKERHKASRQAGREERMIHRIISRIAVIAAVLFAWAASAGAQTTVRIGLAVPNYGPYAPVYAAEELGFYKENGIKAEITAYRGGAAGQEALAAGAADMISFFPPGAALAVKKGIKEKVVAIGSARPLGWHIVVNTSSPYREFKDLAGKKIGITAKGSTTDFYALWAANRAGVTVETVPVGAAALIPTLKSGQIDAAVLNSPLPFKLIIPGEGRSVVDLGKEMDPTLPDVWIATQAMIDQNPKAIEGALRAIYKATAHMKKNRAYAIEFMRKHTGEKDDRVIEQEFDVVLSARPTAAKIERPWIEASLALAKLGGLADLPSVDEIFTDRFGAVTGE
jgi:ABC-type nitrate/sulfonate/bicarbonate transport system substrate-binding protein